MAQFLMHFVLNVVFYLLSRAFITGSYTSVHYCMENADKESFSVMQVGHDVYYRRLMTCLRAASPHWVGFLMEHGSSVQWAQARVECEESCTDMCTFISVCVAASPQTPSHSPAYIMNKQSCHCSHLSLY